MLTRRENLCEHTAARRLSGAPSRTRWPQASSCGVAPLRPAKLLTKPNIAKAINEAMEARRSAPGGGGDEENKAHIGDIMRFTVLDLFDAKGRRLPIEQLPRHVAIAIKRSVLRSTGCSLSSLTLYARPAVRLRAFGRLRDSVRVDRARSWRRSSRPRISAAGGLTSLRPQVRRIGRTTAVCGHARRIDHQTERR